MFSETKNKEPQQLNDCRLLVYQSPISMILHWARLHKIAHTFGMFKTFTLHTIRRPNERCTGFLCEFRKTCKSLWGMFVAGVCFSLVGDLYWVGLMCVCSFCAEVLFLWSVRSISSMIAAIFLLLLWCLGVCWLFRFQLFIGCFPCAILGIFRVYAVVSLSQFGTFRILFFVFFSWSCSSHSACSCVFWRLCWRVSSSVC